MLAGMRNLVLASVLLLSGCSLMFGTGGAVSAHLANDEARSHHKPETASAPTRAVVGGIVGLALDVLIVRDMMHSTDNLARVNPHF